jgi:acyl-CoA synthetase (AMP-forming)/AMP-acid ligase II
MTVAEWIRRCARRTPDALAFVDGERRFSYAQFNERANRHANGLVALGLQRGDRVAVLMNNTVEAVEALAATAKTGMIHVPINFRLAAREVKTVLEHSGSSLLLVDAEYAAVVAQAGAVATLKRVIVVRPGDPASDYERWLAAQPAAEPDIDVSADDDFFICYTSGATGNSKGVLHQHRQSVAHAPVVNLSYGLDASSKLLLVYPHNSIASINMFYVPAWLCGAAVVLTDQRNFNAERWLALVEQEKVTHCHLVPTMLFRILESARLKTTDCSSLRTIGYGSAPMPTERVERLMEAFGNILIQGYGMTEVSSIAAILDKKDHLDAILHHRERLNACGRAAFGCELRVVDDDGKDVATGSVGEIVFRGPQLMSGYWNEPDKTAETIKDGWLYSGDMARLDDEGYIYIVDRKKDLIISGGANISSREVEEALYWHPSVREAGVIGRADEEWGERPHAFISLNPGTSATPAELLAFCRERIAHYKCPAAIDIIDELPKNAVGKILKTELRARLRASPARNDHR